MRRSTEKKKSYLPNRLSDDKLDAVSVSISGRFRNKNIQTKIASLSMTPYTITFLYWTFLSVYRLSRMN